MIFLFLRVSTTHQSFRVGFIYLYTYNKIPGCEVSPSPIIKSEGNSSSLQRRSLKVFEAWLERPWVSTLRSSTFGASKANFDLKICCSLTPQKALNFRLFLKTKVKTTVPRAKVAVRKIWVRYQAAKIHPAKISFCRASFILTTFSSSCLRWLPRSRMDSSVLSSLTIAKKLPF